MSANKILVPLVLVLAVVLAMKLTGVFDKAEPLPVSTPTQTQAMPTYKPATAILDPNLLNVELSNLGLGMSKSTSFNFSINNTGDERLIGSLNTDKNWLKVDPYTINVAGGQQQFFKVLVDKAAPDYQVIGKALITINTNAGAKTLIVSLCYEDDFSNHNSGWDVWSDDESSGGYKDGGYSIQVKKDHWMRWTQNSNLGKFDDFTFAIDASWQAQSICLFDEYGINFRCQDEINHYDFLIKGGTSYSIQKCINGKWSFLQDWTALYQLYSQCHLMIKCQGQFITAYIDGNRLTTVTDSSFSRGYVAPLVGRGISSDISSVLFDNLKISVP